MYDKETYRTLFKHYQKYIKLSKLADDFGMRSSILSLFMKGNAYDYAMSLERCESFNQFVIDNVGNLLS